ncbi:uncharacterized protein IL334_004227 [Kwoniella shivajii]|uniref:GPI mannosyltransferase 1 n=1 Tax=Kwoniella shivajii TaxID=564305 RepID=A0ABZ1D054_9TREE|nr:hypothetical protein IL334_004227 [Kwoniella shivajii]
MKSPSQSSQFLYKVKTSHILALSATIQLGLLVYAQHVDNHPEQYGGLKYTDVDWRVISDGAKLIFNPDEPQGNIARGWLIDLSGFKIGDPYERSTFRYTPLLPLLISPTLIYPLLGRLILVFTSLLIPSLLLSLPNARPSPKSMTTPIKSTVIPQTTTTTSTTRRDNFWSTHLIWTLNPFVMNITTRGSPESIICLLVILTLSKLRKGDLVQAAIWLGLSISWKIYPAIYIPTIWSFLSKRHGWFGKGIFRFGFIVLLTLISTNGLLWSIWGEPFLEHTYLYHLKRLDHRHNFSPYFYPIYLSLFPTSTNSSIPTMIERVLRHPLTSFLPQNTLVLLSGFILEPITGIEFTMFIQTTIFIVFNKVCTSQYFMWFLPLIPPIIPQLHLAKSKTIILILLWVVGQALWLSIGYNLEFMAKQVYLYLWMSGLVLFGISVWVIGEILDGFT